MAKKLKPFDELSIRDNFMFGRVMRNRRLCKRLLEAILNIKIQKIAYPITTEKTLEQYYRGKNVRLDVFVEDNRGTLYDIEMQTTNGATKDELAKRTRYYQAMMDTNTLNKGEDYHKLKKTYIIFICTFDPFGLGRSIYTFQETCQEDKSLLMGDSTTKIFLNSKGTREGIQFELAAFLDYVKDNVVNGKLADSIHKEVVKVKKNEEEREIYMMLSDVIAEYQKEAQKEEQYKIALRMLQKHTPLKLVAEFTDLSLAELDKLIEDNGLEQA